MKYASFVLLLLLASSCNLDSSSDEPLEPVDFRAENEVQINEYLTANELVSQKTASGLHYIIDVQGEGAQPTVASNVTVVYKGYFLNGDVFDESDSDGIDIGLNSVIAGWSEGIPLFNEGGTGMLLIPAHLGYGSFTRNGIPGGSVLLFDIELRSVN